MLGLPRSLTGLWIQLVGVSALYYLLGLCGWVMGGAGTSGQVYLIWPPTGVALFAFLSWGPWICPAIFLPSILLSLGDGTSMLASFLIAVGNVITPMAGAYLSKRAAFDRRLFRLRDYLVFGGVGCITVCTTNACLGNAALVLAGDISIRDVGVAWMNWWISDFLGGLLIGLTLITLFPNSGVPTGDD